MEIFKGTGKTTTGTILLTKSVSTIIVATDLEYDQLTTETIRVEVERANGSNFEITKGSMFLKDFVLANTYGEDAFVSDTVRGYGLIAVCEICNEGSIHLFEKDVIKITLNGLDDKKTYVLNGIEEPQTSTEIYSFEHKSMSADDTNKDFNVSGYDILVLDKSDTIEEINYTFQNGQVVKFSLYELECMSRAIDPVSYVKKNGTVLSSFRDKIQLPLVAVSNVNIRKLGGVGGSVINLILRNHL